MGVIMETPSQPATDLKGGHPLITWAAIEALPAWQRQIWQSQQYEMSKTYSLYGDTYYGHKAELAPFVELPDGSIPTWGIGTLRLKKNYSHAVDYFESPFYEGQVRVLSYFVDRISASIASGDMASAAKFAGTMSHHIGDSGVPAHSVDNGDLEFVKDYLAFPPEMVCFPLHGYTEQSPKPFLLENYKPRLFGRSAAEAGALLVHRYVELTLHARSLLLPLAKCAYQDQHEEASKLRLQAARKCAEVLADYYYTATCIGTGRFEDVDMESLRTLRLTDCWPYRMTAWAPAPYFEPGPMRLRGINLDMSRNSTPCELLVQEDEAALPVRFEESLGAGAYFEYHFKLPAGTFKKFRSLVGVSSSLGARRSINIIVKLDEKVGLELKVSPGQAAKAIDLDITGCHDLQLISSGPWYTDPDGVDNHIVWAQPRVSW